MHSSHFRAKWRIRTNLAQPPWRIAQNVRPGQTSSCGSTPLRCVVKYDDIVHVCVTQGRWGLGINRHRQAHDSETYTPNNRGKAPRNNMPASRISRFCFCLGVGRLPSLPPATAPRHHPKTENINAPVGIQTIKQWPSRNQPLISDQ